MLPETCLVQPSGDGRYGGRAGGGACYLKLLLELRVKSALRWDSDAVSGSDYVE
jgi:hypothetical protein